MVDPREVGLANKADLWLRPRPGSDGALALGIAQVMLERGWFDRDFVRDWTNGPLLVRADNGRLLRGSDLAPGGDGGAYVAWDERASGPLLYDAVTRRYERVDGVPALDGEYQVATFDGTIACRPAFALARELCGQYSPTTVEEITWVPAGQIETAARLLWDARPVSYFAWAGVEQHTNTTQFARALGLLYALTGSFGSRGGNVQFAAAASAPVTGDELMPPGQRTRTLGLRDRPLGPALAGYVSSDELYRAILDEDPYPVRGLVGFGSNLLLARADTLRGRAALQALDFYVHADLFMNPTAELADVVLPVSSPFEREALKIGFDISTEAQSLVQLRRPVVAPIGKRGRTRISCSIWLAGWVSGSTSGMAISTPAIVTNWVHPTSPSKSCGRIPRECGFRWKPATARSRTSRTAGSRGLRHRPEKPRSTRSDSWSMGSRRCPHTRSRW